MKFKALVHSCIFIGFLIPQAAFTQVAENLPLDHWAYEDIFHLRNRGYFQELFLSDKPFNRMEIAEALRELQTDGRSESHAPNGYEAFLLQRLRAEFAVESNYLNAEKSDGKYAKLEIQPRNMAATTEIPTRHQRVIADGEIGLRLGRSAFVYQRYEADTDGQLDPDYRGSFEKFGISGSIKAAYLMFEIPWFRVTLGRDAFAWGQSPRHGLLITPNSPAFDMFAISGRFWRLAFSALTSSISKIDHPELGRINRYLSAHRLSFKPTNSLELGISEAIIYGGPGRKFDLLFSNPFLFYFAAEAEIKEENNLFWGADVSWHLGSHRFYGELLIDDFSLDRESPDKVGYQIGVEVAEPFRISGWDMQLEYTRVSNWVYNFGFDTPWNRFVNYRGIIGHPLGPDADAIFLRNSFYLGSGFRVITTSQLARSGEGRIDTPTPVRSGNNFGYNDEKFPSGVVETTLSNSLTLEYSPSIYWFFQIDGGLVRIHDLANVSGVDDSQVRFQVSVNYRFRKYFYLQR